MKWVMKLFLLAFKLYPRPFRERFSNEIEEVFRAGLEEAREQGALAGFVLREALHLPGSIAGVYVWAMRTGEGERMALSGAGGGVTSGAPLPGEGWGAALLAGLPHLLLGIFVVSSVLLGEVKGIDQNVVTYPQVAVYALMLIGVLLFGLFKGWRRWSASWLVYLFIFALALLGLAVNTLAPSFTARNDWVYGVQAIVLPLALAYLLYKTACVDRLRGLLAAVPLTAVLWSYFMEFVPALPRSLAWGWLCLLAFTAAVMMLRTRRFAVVLGLAMAVPALGGLPFAYLGVYQGGTLPFSEPGPSLQEVFRQYLPFLAAMLAITLGPQLAVKLRAFGRASAKAGGQIFYRLALGGLLLGLAVTLLHWTIVTSAASRWISILATIRQVGFIVAIALYLAGFALLVWAALEGGAFSGNIGAGLRLPALFILLPGVPLTLLLTIPNVVMARHLENWLLSAAEVAWALAAAWVVKD